MNQFSKPWTRFQMTEKEWQSIPEENRQRLIETRWANKPCKICGKKVKVLSTHTGDTWCMEHKGTWGDPSL